MSQSIELAEGQKSAQFLIENDGVENMAIELSISERHMNEFGIENLPETSELTIFPPQLIIPPKEKRTIRVNWNGPSDISEEKAFRVIAEQLPLKVDDKTKKRSGIQMLMKYMAALYVTPKEVSSKLEITSFKSDGKNITLLIENKGNKHQVLINPTVTFLHQNKKHVLKNKDLGGLVGENVLAKSKRSFTIINAASINKDSSVVIKVDE